MKEEFWVFLEEYGSTEVWGMYRYLEDVIKQIETVMQEGVSTLD